MGGLLIIFFFIFASFAIFDFAVFFCFVVHPSIMRLARKNDKPRIEEQIATENPCFCVFLINSMG
jgi:hypothetical protein